jgi:hypothetical protein
VSEQPALGDRLALELLEHGPLSGSRLALQVESRKTDVLGALRADPRFVHTGEGRGSRWGLALRPWEPMGTVPRGRPRSDDGLDIPARLRALERRVAKLERKASTR